MSGVGGNSAVWALLGTLNISAFGSSVLNIIRSHRHLHMWSLPFDVCAAYHSVSSGWRELASYYCRDGDTNLWQTGKADEKTHA
jgi:hypothetical protein